MTKVAITQSKLDELALHISAKSGEAMPLTIQEMQDAVDGIEQPNLQAVTVSPSESQQVIEPDSQHNGLSSVTVNAAPLEAKTVAMSASGTTTYTTEDGYYGMKSVAVTVPAATVARGVTSGFTTQSGVRKWRVRPYTNTTARGIIYEGTVYGNYQNYDAVPSGTTVTPSTSAQTVGGANYMMEAAVTVNPIPSQYIVPTGTKSITSNGTGIDVTEYAAVDVAVSGGSVTQDQDGYIVLPSTGGGGGGGSSASMSDPIRFFDYDGTLVASYSSVPASLPSVPSHTGLTSGAWNYTLQQITTQFNAMGTCDVGANYTTSSGATEIDIVLQEGRLHPYLSLAVNGTVTIDWGDNSTSTSTGTSLTTRKSDIHHEYASAGSYTIKISKTSGTGYSLYCTSTYSLLNKNASAGSANRVYSNCVQAVRVGADCTIGNYAFENCYSLESVTIPSSVTSIGSSAFQNCYSLASITIPSDVTSIGNSIFLCCYLLASISIPRSVTSIGDNVFQSCNLLSSISIPSSVTSIGGNAFYGCTSLESIVISSSVTGIGNYMFAFCRLLASISIQNGATSIGSNAFQSCESLASVTIPSSVTSIGTSAFQNCYSLASITIPSDVTSIGDSAFSGCYGMAEYHVLPTTPPTLGTTVFNNIQSDCTIYVPSAKLSDYQTAENWSAYASYMVGE